MNDRQSKDLQRCIQKMVAGQGKEVFSALQYCGGRTTDTYTPLSQDRVKSIKINIGRQELGFGLQGLQIMKSYIEIS